MGKGGLWGGMLGGAGQAGESEMASGEDRLGGGREGWLRVAGKACGEGGGAVAAAGAGRRVAGTGWEVEGVLVAGGWVGGSRCWVGKIGGLGHGGHGRWARRGKG